MKHKWLQKVLLLAVLMLCAVLCAACGTEHPYEDYFSDNEIKKWENEEEENEYVMNGGYILHYKGNYYPVEFKNGSIYWTEGSPDELFFVDMSALYTDSALKERCCFVGCYSQWPLFGFIGPDDEYYGYILDGKRPKYGSVLYIDETKEIQFCYDFNSMSYESMHDGLLFEPDDKLVFYAPTSIGNDILTEGEQAVAEHLDTPRKLFSYMKKYCTTVKTEYSNIEYPDCFYYSWGSRNSYTEHTGYDIYQYTAPPIEINVAKYEVDRDTFYFYLNYQDANFPNKNVIVCKDKEYAYTYTNQILSAPDYYTDVVLDEENLVTKYFNTYSEIEYIVVHSPEEWISFLESDDTFDEENMRYVSHFVRSLDYPEEEYDGSIFYAGQLCLYAVMEDCETVTLHSKFELENDEVYVGQKKNCVLPSPKQPGYTFRGWYTDESFSGQPVTEVSYSDGITDLYAKFEKVDYYTLSFETSDGQKLDDIQYQYGQEVQLPVLSKTFCVFKGWCIDPECRTEPMMVIPSEFYGDYHLYPCFEGMEYTLIVVVEGKAERIQVRYGEDFSLPTDGVGVGFLGYFDQDGIQYTDENGNSLAPFTDGADIQLFAKYKEE